jgi:calcineurin-like phosphoesterase family protein
MIYFTSDLHFNHIAVIRYCNRPFASVEEMNTALINNWNSLIRDNDTVYILGDLTLSPYREFEAIGKSLNGKKILIKGNHDGFSNGQYEKMGFQVFEEVKMKLVGSIVRLSHYPYPHPWYKRWKAYKSELRFMDRRPVKIKGEWLLHGHTHTKKRVINNMIHVGVDAWDYRPVSIVQIESIIARSKK